MHGPKKQAGGVAALEGVKTPSLLAKAVMENTDHHLLVGEGAQTFARQLGFQVEDDLNTPRSRERWLEWKRRIDNWRMELSNHVYRPLGVLSLNGFLTYDQLTADEAQEGAFEPMPIGTAWGAKWEYDWFRGQVVLPETAAGKRVVLVIDVGAESAVYVNGVAAGSSAGERSDAVAGIHFGLAAGEGVGSSHELCSAGGTKRPTASSPLGFICVLE